MSITIELSPETEARVRAQATAFQLSIDAYLRQLIERDGAESEDARRLAPGPSAPARPGARRHRSDAPRTLLTLRLSTFLMALFYDTRKWTIRSAVPVAFGLRFSESLTVSV